MPLETCFGQQLTFQKVLQRVAQGLPGRTIQSSANRIKLDFHMPEGRAGKLLLTLITLGFLVTKMTEHLSDD